MRYQDFVIKEGKFIGEFERMYQNIEDPWHQKKEGYVENSIARQIVCNYIKIFNINSIAEFGCGLGKTSNFVYSNTKIEITGIDISETSIRKAKEAYPFLDFRVDNVINISNYSGYDCVYFAEITWYMLEDKLIDRVFEDMKKHLKGKYFIHNLVFYKGTQKYGVDYFTSLEEFIKFCPFQLIGKSEINLEHLDTIETSAIFRIN